MNSFKKYDHEIDSFSKELESDIQKFSLKKEDLKKFLSLKRASKSLLGENYNSFLKKAWEQKELLKKLNTKNDFYFFVTSMAIGENHMKKVAYPMMENNFFKNPFFGYNLQSWASCVHQIYESVYKEGLQYSDAVIKYSSNNFKDEEERKSFLSWLKYYNKGEHLRYNVKIAKDKTASFQLPLSAGGDAYSGSESYISTDYALDHDRQMNDAKEKSEIKLNYKNWKKKFNTALRRVDKILKESEEYVDSDRYEEISQILHKLDVQVGKIRLQSSASDISFRAANQLTKLGFSKGADVLYKYSQDATPDVAPEEQSVSEEGAPVPNATQKLDADGRTPSEVARKQKDKLDVEKGREELKDISPLPGPAPDEYKSIMIGNPTVDDASRKLEQIAGTLSDRRVIRYLAEFDIILDKIGIASMFPELAEAQSKLIESYSYALTRVTKMLGMLSNNKSISEVPTDEDQDAEKEEATTAPSKEVASEKLEGETSPEEGAVE